MTLTAKAFIKIVLGGIATIFLGAIGSGLWEKFLGPFLDWLSRITVGTFAWGQASYRDSIYESAAKGFHEAQSLALYTWALAILPMFYVFVLQRHPILRSTAVAPSEFREFIRSRKGYWLVLVLTMIIFFAVNFSALRLRHINETITYSLATFEIVRPYVGEDQYARYRSRYFSLRTAAEFETLHKEVQGVAKARGIQLPDYQPL